MRNTIEIYYICVTVWEVNFYYKFTYMLTNCFRQIKATYNLLKTILGTAYVIYILFMNRNIIKNGRPPMAHKSKADMKLNVRQKAWKCNIHKDIKCKTFNRTFI